jgi:hypothetical protein
MQRFVWERWCSENAVLSEVKDSGGAANCVVQMLVGGGKFGGRGH